MLEIDMADTRTLSDPEPDYPETYRAIARWEAAKAEQRQTLDRLKVRARTNRSPIMTELVAREQRRYDLISGWLRVAHRILQAMERFAAAEQAYREQPNAETRRTWKRAWNARYDAVTAPRPSRVY